MAWHARGCLARKSNEPPSSVPVVEVRQLPVADRPVLRCSSPVARWSLRAPAESRPPGPRAVGSGGGVGGDMSTAKIHQKCFCCIELYPGFNCWSSQRSQNLLADLGRPLLGRKRKGWIRKVRKRKEKGGYGRRGQGDWLQKGKLGMPFLMCGCSRQQKHFWYILGVDFLHYFTSDDFSQYSLWQLIVFFVQSNVCVMHCIDCLLRI